VRERAILKLSGKNMASATERAKNMVQAKELRVQEEVQNGDIGVT
jgi:hypothetical protein